MPTTTNYAWPYPSTSDSSNGPAQFQSLATAQDTTVKTIDLAARDKPVFVARKSASQNINDSTITAVTWTGADDIDSVGGHNPASNSSRYTVQTGWAGAYRATVELIIAGDVDGIRDIGFMVNGNTALPYRANHYAGLPAFNVTIRTGGIIPVKLNVGDYLEVFVYQTAGNVLAVSAGTGTQSGTWDVEWLGR